MSINIFLDQQIRVYDTRNGEYRLVKTIQARDIGWSIIDVALSPDQQYFVYSTWCTSCKYRTGNMILQKMNSFIANNALAHSFYVACSLIAV